MGAGCPGLVEHDDDDSDDVTPDSLCYHRASEAGQFMLETQSGLADGWHEGDLLGDADGVTLQTGAGSFLFTATNYAGATSGISGEGRLYWSSEDGGRFLNLELDQPTIRLALFWNWPATTPAPVPIDVPVAWTALTGTCSGPLVPIGCGEAAPVPLLLEYANQSEVLGQGQWLEG